MEETAANIGSDALTERRVEPNDIPLPISACLPAVMYVACSLARACSCHVLVRSGRQVLLAEMFARRMRVAICVC